MGFMKIESHSPKWVFMVSRSSFKGDFLVVIYASEHIFVKFQLVSNFFQGLGIFFFSSRTRLAVFFQWWGQFSLCIRSSYRIYFGTILFGWLTPRAGLYLSDEQCLRVPEHWYILFLCSWKAAWDSSLSKHKGLSQVEKVMLSYWFKIRPFKGLSQVEKLCYLIGSKFDPFIQKKMALKMNQSTV